jgi:hypothetical protein
MAGNLDHHFIKAEGLFISYSGHHGDRIVKRSFPV